MEAEEIALLKERQALLDENLDLKGQMMHMQIRIDNNEEEIRKIKIAMKTRPRITLQVDNVEVREEIEDTKATTKEVAQETREHIAEIRNLKLHGCAPYQSEKEEVKDMKKKRKKPINKRKNYSQQKRWIYSKKN